MNMLGFTKQIFDFIEDGFDKFYEKNKDNLDSCEYLIPDVVFNNIENNNIKVKVLTTNAKWYGVTYKEDKEDVVKALKDMTLNGTYNNPLWK